MEVSRNPLGRPVWGPVFRAGSTSQTLGTSSDQGFEEVLSDVPAIALFDHLNRRTAVLDEVFEIRTLAQRPRDEGVPRAMKLQRLNSQISQTPEPDPF